MFNKQPLAYSTGLRLVYTPLIQLLNDFIDGAAVVSAALVNKAGLDDPPIVYSSPLHPKAHPMGPISEYGAGARRSHHDRTIHHLLSFKTYSVDVVVTVRLILGEIRGGVGRIVENQLQERYTHGVHIRRSRSSPRPQQFGSGSRSEVNRVLITQTGSSDAACLPQLRFLRISTEGNTLRSTIA